MGQHLVLGYTYESSTIYKDRVWWSAFGNPEGWTSGTNLAGFEDAALSGNGEITGVVGGDYGVVFQLNKATRMDYVGAPTIWSFTEIEESYGAVLGPEQIRVGDDIYYLSASGFRVIRNGTRSESIGKGVIDNWVREQLSYASQWNSVTQNWSAAYDPVSNSVWWCLNTSSGSTWHFLIYQIDSGQWTVMDDGVTGIQQRVVTPVVPLNWDSPDTNDWVNDSILILRYDGSTQFDWLKASGASVLTAEWETGPI